VPHFERDGTSIFYTDTAGAGPAVVFSHGLLMDHEMFAPQMEALSPDFRCIAWDARGHGATTTEGSWSYWDSAEDLLALLDHLDVGTALLVGMSQGGFVSLRAALRGPEHVAGLFLVDSQAGTEPEPVVLMYEAIVDEWVANGPDEHILAAVDTTILGPAESERWRQKWKAWPRDAVKRSFQTLLGREDLSDRLGEITAPALVVHGEVDAAIPTEWAEALCAGLPNCEGFVVVPEAGHAANLSHPDEVNRLLLDFARRHLAS
jgi:pimeloyl-ACP methyl ester carboxylesterase